MKQTNRKKFFKSNMWYAATLGITLFSFLGTQQTLFGSSAVTTCTVAPGCAQCNLSNTFGSATYTMSYPSCVCVGDTFTVVFTITISSSYGGGGILVQDFAPDPAALDSQCPGLSTFTTGATGPNPSIPCSYYNVGDGQHCPFTYVGGFPFGPSSSGQGTIAIPANGDCTGFSTIIVPNVVYTWTYEVLALDTGLQTWIPTGNSSQNCDALFTATILVTSRAEVSDVTYPPACENITVNGTLPAPTDTSGSYTYTVGNAAGGTVVLDDISTGTFTFTPSFNFIGTATFDYNVSPTGPGLPQFCPAFHSGVASIVYNQSPIAGNAVINACQGASVTGSLVPYVTGGSGSYIFSSAGPVSCIGAYVTIYSSGDFIFTGATGATECTFQYLATDSTAPGCTGIGTVTANLQVAPVATPQVLQTCVNTAVSGTLTGTGGRLPYTAFTITTPPTNGTISNFVSVTGAFTYTPNLGFTGTDTFQFTVTDSNGCTSISPATVTITVSPQPIALTGMVTGCENTTFTGSLVQYVTGGTGAFEFEAAAPTPTCGNVFINANGVYTFVPNTNATGTCSFGYQVTQGGCPGTGPGTISVTILPAPITTGASTGICAGGTVTDNLNNYVISSSGTLSFTGGPGVNGTLDLSTAGPFTFMPTIGSGVASFMWSVTSDTVPCPSPQQTYSVLVFPPPTVNTGQISACSGTTKLGSLLSNVPGVVLPVTFTGPGISINGATVINSNGTFTFTPNPGVTGGSFTFGVKDGHGCVATGTELVVVNPTPVALGATAGVCAGTPTAGSLTGLVSGGTPGYIFGQNGPTTGGVVMINPNGTYVFTPASGATSGSFVYKATDTKGCVGSATVIVQVNPGPSASTGLFTGCEGTDITGSLASLVTGPNPPFTFTGPFSETGGLVTINPNGDFTFIPLITTGVGSFTYEVIDSAVPPCTSKPTLVSVAIEEGPEALPSLFNTCENTPFMSGLAPYVSGGIPPYTFTEVAPFPTCGAVTIDPASGDFTFTPTTGFTGPCDFIWQVNDATPCFSNTAVATVVVHNNPVASSSGPFQACELQPFPGDLNAFTTGGMPPYSFTGGNVINGTLDLSPSGPFVFTPAAVIGLGSFNFSATDSFGCMSNTGTLTFNINASPILTGPSPLDTCQGVPVSSTVTATGGTPPYVSFSIVSSTNGTAVITSTTGTTANYTFTPTVTVFPTPTVVGSVTLQVTDSNPATGGCTAQVTILINIHQNPIVSSTGVNTCTGALFTGSLVNLVTGGIPPYTFGPTGTIAPSGCGSVVIDPSGDYTFTSPAGFSGPCTFDFEVTEDSASHCIGTGSVTVNVYIPSVANDTLICSCGNAPVTSSLAPLVTGGTPPYTFAIVSGTCTVLGPQITSCVVTGGTVILNTVTGQFTFNPTPGFAGIASFDFVAIDAADCTSNVGTVDVQVPCCPFTGATT